MSHLIPCLSCQRHVRASDERCPFCGVALLSEQRASAPPRLPGRRLGRAALFTFGATLFGAAACSSGSSGTDAGKDTAADSATGTGGSTGSGGSSGGSGGGSGSGGSGSGGQVGSGGSGGPDGGNDAKGRG